MHYIAMHIFYIVPQAGVQYLICTHSVQGHTAPESFVHKAMYISGNAKVAMLQIIMLHFQHSIKLINICLNMITSAALI